MLVSDESERLTEKAVNAHDGIDDVRLRAVLG